MRLRSRPTLFAALTLATGLVAPLAPQGAQAAAAPDGAAAVAEHSLRGPVTDENFYFVMADRFSNGDRANDTGGLGTDPLVSGFDPTSKGFYNGGDLKGLKDKLDYIQGLGTDSIWLTPSFKNKAVQLEDGPSAGYHGYWITDFTRIDPHLGTNADLKALVDAAHARGMKLYFDIITNHTADVIGYEQGARTAYVSKDAVPYRTAEGERFDDRNYPARGPFPALDPSTSFPYTPVLEPDERDLKVPAWLNDVTLYHNRGDTTFTGEDSQYGDFFGLDDLFSEDPRVVDGFIDIYRTWVDDFGIDGFRIDTMKHVDDAFWKEFGPGLVDYARANGKPEFFMFGEVAFDGFDAAAKSFTSHYTTHNGIQAVLDFPFKDAARAFASRSEDAGLMAQFFADDDWYTDADSNAYGLPTFLGNHDNGRIGSFISADNPDAGEPELLARDRLAHELMYFSRGNPVVYYGDEQGFTGTGGDQLARQTMFPSQVPEYLSDDLLGTTRTHAQSNFETTHPLYERIRRLAQVTELHPALRDGAQQVRAAASGAGVLAFSRLDRTQQREYVVALNNSEAPSTASIPTYGAASYELVYGAGAPTATPGSDGRLQMSVPALSAVVYASTDRIPVSPAAPAITLDVPAPAEVAQSRMHVSADVAGSSFYEVTFQAKVDGGGWRTIGTDDSAPYQVFHDTRPYRTATPVEYRAVVRDNAGSSRTSATRSTTVPAPALALVAPVEGSTVSTVDPVLVSALPDPERARQTVLLQRSVAGGAWQTIGRDSSSPAYLAHDDVSDLPLGTRVAYRALLFEPTSPTVVSETVRVTTGAPQPARNSVTLAGDLQSELGCPGDWDPACATTHLSFSTTDGQWHGTFDLPQGAYAWKIAIDDDWAESYGDSGAPGGRDLSLEVPAGGGTYRFTWNQVTHVPSVEKVS